MAVPSTKPLSTSQNAEDAKPEKVTAAGASCNTITAAKNSSATKYSGKRALAHSAMTTSVTSADSAIGSPNIVSSLIKRCDCYQTVNRVAQGAGANLETAHISSFFRFFSMHTLQP